MVKKHFEPRLRPLDSGQRSTAAVTSAVLAAAAAFVLWRWMFGEGAEPEFRQVGEMIGIGGGAGGREMRLWPWAVAGLLGVLSLGLVSMAMGAKVDRGLEGPSDAPPERKDDSKAEPSLTSRGTAYRCPACGAWVAASTKISPRGDALCTHCDSWVSLPRDN